MMGFWKTIPSYLQKQGLLIERNAAEVEESNGKLAFAILVMGCIVFIPLLTVSFTVDSYRELSGAYLVELSGLLLLLLLFHRLKKRIPCCYILYGAYGFMAAFSAYTSAFITPDFTCVTILFFLFQIPIVVIDKSWRVNLLVVLIASMYLDVVIPLKDPTLVADEIINCLLFSAFGIGIGETMRSVRLENFELKRQGLVREYTDDLTGLKNRKSLFDYLYRMMDSKGRPSAGIFMIDIDYFKRFNDTYGHQAGDLCLKQIGGCFQRFGKEHQVDFYRYGGEEFVGIIKNCTQEELLQTAGALNQAVLELQIPHTATKEGFVTISIGLASMADVPTASYEQQVLSQADIALYEAKTQGRNRAVAYAPGMTMRKTTMT